jgi:hypothetical protein
MNRYIFARSRPSPWRRTLRTVVVIVAPLVLIAAAGAAGLLMALRVNQIAARQEAAAAAPTATALLRNAAAADGRERQFLAVEIARDACKHAVLARMPHPTQISRAGFYQTAVFMVRSGGKGLLRVTGQARAAPDGDVAPPPAFSCDVKDGQVVTLALLPPRRGAGGRS